MVNSKIHLTVVRMYASANAKKQWRHFCIYRDLYENPVLHSLRMEFSFVVFLHNASKVWNFKFEEQVGVCYLKNLNWFFCFPSTAVHCGPWLPIHSCIIPNNIWSLHTFHTHTHTHTHTHSPSPFLSPNKRLAVAEEEWQLVQFEQQCQKSWYCLSSKVWTVGTVWTARLEQLVQFEQQCQNSWFWLNSMVRTVGTVWTARSEQVWSLPVFRTSSETIRCKYYKEKGILFQTMRNYRPA